jgi:hypothetical protein
MKLLVRLLRQVRQKHGHSAKIDPPSAIVQMPDRSSMADFVRILQAQDGTPAIERARYRAMATASTEWRSLASLEDEASE